MRSFGWTMPALLALAAATGCQERTRTNEEADDRESAGQREASARVRVVLAYNRYLQLSFNDHPAPFGVIQDTVRQRHPGIDVSLNLLPDSTRGHRDALVIWLMARDASVDLYGIDAPWIPEFGETGWAVPLDTLVPELESDFLPAGLEVFSWKGQRLGVPFWGSLGGLFWRKDLLASENLSRPETYPELAGAVYRVRERKPNLSGFVWAGGKNEDLIQTWAEIFLGTGGEYFDRTGRCAVNSPAGWQALTFMRWVIQEGVSPREVTGWTAEEARQRFVGGEAIFLRHNHDLLAWLDDTNRSSIAGRWAFGPNPAGLSGSLPASITGGFAFALNPYSRRQDAAVKVLRVIASREVQKAFALAWGPVQYYRDLYRDPEVRAAHPHLDQLERVLPYAASRPRGVDYARVSDILQQEVHAAITGLKPVQEALDSACARIDALAPNSP